MTEYMSLRSFRKFCEEKNFTHFHYSADEQNRHNFASTFRVYSVLKIMEIFENPNQIFFQSDDTTFLFDSVKQVKVDTESEESKTIFTIFCGRTTETAYRVVATQKNIG